MIDGPDGDDDCLRPNQLFALSLAHPILDARRWPAVLSAVRTRLLTPYGLRTLAPAERGYCAELPRRRCGTRDAAYHQGTVWPWLIGHYLDAACARTRIGAPRGPRSPQFPTICAWPA